MSLQKNLSTGTHILVSIPEDVREPFTTTVFMDGLETRLALHPSPKAAFDYGLLDAFFLKLAKYKVQGYDETTALGFAWGEVMREPFPGETEPCLPRLI